MQKKSQTPQATGATAGTISPSLLQQVKSLDMAAEAHQLLRGQAGQEIPGVAHRQTDFSCGVINTIEILDEQGAEIMGRPIGSYITIEVPELKNEGLGLDSTASLLLPVSAALAENIQTLLPPELTNQKQPDASSANHKAAGRKRAPGCSALVVGLGNFQTTADAIGPQTIAHIQPTRHFFRPEFAGEIRPVAAFTPGVVGNTGIETAQLIKGVVQQIKPACLIVVDALAARSISSIMSSIQICNTGIRPGSGVQNKRQAVNQAYLGVPVIAIGIPTVVHGATIIRESAELCLQRLAAEAPGLPEEVLQTLLEPFADNLVMTPKEADTLVPLAARLIAAGITRALHPGADEQNFSQYMQGF